MSAIKSLGKDERGVALIMALATLVIVSLLGAGALTLAGGTINQTVWDRSSNQAFHFAEAGFDQAMARVRANGVSGTTQFTAQLEGGEASVTVTQINVFMYHVKSVGAEPSLAAPKARRAVEATIMHLDPSRVFFADSAQGTVIGSATFDGPLYVRDKLQATGDAEFTGGPFFIKDNPATLSPTGDLDLGGSGQMGESGQKVFLFVEGNQPYSPSGSQLYAYTPIYTDVPDLTMPVLTPDDMADERADADLVIDSNGANDNSENLVFNKNRASQTWGGGSGELIWTNSGPVKRLQVTGKVFLDGQLSLGGTGGRKTNVTYVGKGTIVANGPIFIQTSLRPDVLADWPDNASLGLVTPYYMDIVSGTNSKVYAVVYAWEKVLFKWQVYFYGNVSSQVLDTQNNPHIFVQLPTDPDDFPAGMPKMDAMTTISGWREVQP